MVSDEELKQHIRTAEEGEAVAAFSRLGEVGTTARSVHNELARRIEAVDASTASREELSAIREEMERLCERLDDIEARLD
jgi:polyhydroxyalkanoate synthesis regulator phasin